ncbi:MFS transporter [Parasporobacterium paucivorans]|uniref:MFS transporter, DHA3 family, macrolide efflux protein n=1 Tax=Parasporobacterium paucivorans DSM 15970 TaxID=1122934 RepID=A0A1M6GHC4_9FIRM|nr:MFS transporter [Parasporobacterium paucivorans]SHJ09288.1 MFS transporter, DHA3 family, macrolide efflux protein [Parasporobacterium paucivorans DSM 15970]
MPETKWKRKFFVLWGGQAVSMFTSSVIHMAIIWYLTDTTRSAAILSIGTLVGFLPYAVLGPFTGVFVDRYSRKAIMIVSDIFIAMLTLVLVVAGSVGTLQIWLIMLILFLRAIASTLYNPSLQAVTPLIVPKENLIKCAGYSQTFESVSMLISPAVAAILYSALDINLILLLDVAGAAVAVGATATIRIPKLEKKESHKPAILREAKEGVSVLRKEKGMMGLMLISALYAIIYMPIGTLYPLLCMSYFGGTFAQASVAEIAFSLGTLIGALILGKWGEKMDKVGAIRKSIGVMGVGLIVTGLLPSGGFNVFVVLAAVMGMTIPFYYGVLTAILQIKISQEYLGRVMSLSLSLSMIAMPIGLILSGAFTEIIGVEKWFFLSGIAAVILAVFSRMLPSLRNIHI